MTTSQREDLRNVRTFPQLIRYLRDQLGWPIQEDDFEELTFDYNPEELGIDAENSAKIEEIRRLRPLSVPQPWGIFFIKFEPKRLPVVALRRILGQVAFKRRAGRIDRKAWAAEDLLFISNFGRGEERQLAFAHFSPPPDAQDLPTLKVLGWDSRDTPLHLDAVTEELQRNLAWPADESDLARWREMWKSAFSLRHRQVITSSRELSARLAELARAIRERIKTVLSIETERGPMTRLMKAFQEALVHDLNPDGFADMYAQTVAYGLLSARITNPNVSAPDHLASLLPVTNPFLKEMMEAFLRIGGRQRQAGGPGIDFDELGVSEIVELLDSTNTEAIVRDFGDRNPEDDPVILFYEDFLAAYDRDQKVTRGVFYTPRQIVSYIVRSVDELLRSEFDLPDGLADVTTWGEVAARGKRNRIPDGVSPDQSVVRILDPAAGTGTFLVETIEVIYRTMRERWLAEGRNETEMDLLWNQYVPAHLLPRLHGYELLMAPYAIAHLKIGLKLVETGYRFGSSERVRVYLTNSLEPASDVGQQTFPTLLAALAHEAKAVNEVKRDLRFTVILGNPPYSGQSANLGEWIRNEMRNYYLVDGVPLGEKNPKWLLDDYVKFIRLGEYLLSLSGLGILGYITNHAFMDNPTFRGMRRSLQISFSHIKILDLHGNTKKKERSPDGSVDENVFDIQQGVAVSLCVRSQVNRHAGIFHGDLYGTRATKYAFLARSSQFTTPLVGVVSRPKLYLLVPQDQSLADEYERWMSITEIMPIHSNGIVTGRDHLCVQWTRDEMWRTVKHFASLDVRAARESYSLGPDSRDWQVALAKADLRRDGPHPRGLTRVLYRPFDVRWTYFTGRSRGFLCMPRPKTMRNMLGGENIALVTSRMTKGETFHHAQVSRHVTEAILMSPKTSNNGFIFPLWIVAKGQRETKDRSKSNDRTVANLSSGWIAELSMVAGSSVEPKDCLAYVYAVLHSPEYRRRYAEFLRLDFPRLPLPGGRDLLKRLVSIGEELISLHLLESPAVGRSVASYFGPKNPVVERVSWSRDIVWLDAPMPSQGKGAQSGGAGFRGVPENLWNFQIGGYQVLAKWLKDRKGRVLSDEEIAHFQKVTAALAETLRMMDEVDEIIEDHGGWPGAFQSGDASRSKGVVRPKGVAELKDNYEGGTN